MTFEEWWENAGPQKWTLTNRLIAKVAWQVAQPNVEDLISTCIPGGSICDPQQVADAIRDYFGVLDD